jgi:prepilin-type N-terminal cleavage/methylation domain-containing protein
MRLIRRLRSGQSGFSLVEALIAIAILSVGLLALATGLSQGMIIMSTSHYHQVAKEKAAEAMESVFTSRDANRFASWDSIQNEDNGGIFLNGAQPLRIAGADGLVNTLDDRNITQIESDPGKNGIPGDGDDVLLSNYTREIQIEDRGTNLRQITIIISYQVGGMTREYRLTSLMSPFA